MSIPSGDRDIQRDRDQVSYLHIGENMSHDDYRPRLSIEVPKEVKDRLATMMPHGTQKIVFNLIIMDLLELLEEHGAGKVIGAFIQRDITLKSLLRARICEDGRTEDGHN